MSTYSPAGNPTVAQTVTVKTGPKAGTLTTVHRLAEATAPEAEVALAGPPLARRASFVREQEAVERAAEEAADLQEIASYCTDVAKYWPSAVRLHIDPDADGDDTAWPMLLDANGAVIDAPDNVNHMSPTDLLMEFDYSSVHKFEGTTLNVAETAAKDADTPDVHDSDFENRATYGHWQRALAAGALISKAQMADYCEAVQREWPDAVTASFEPDADGDAYVWVKLYDEDGYEVETDDGAQNRLQAFEFKRMKAYAWQTVHVSELAAWEPATD